jgi:hypothetical protein
MTLITLAELKAEATLPTRNISLTGWSDAQLQDRIDWAISYIQRESNRIFTDTTYTKTDDEYHCSRIYLQPTPIKSIETFLINEVSVGEDDYTWNSSTGIVTLLTDPTEEYSYTITYIVSETDTDIISIARDICMDLVFIKLTPPTQIKGGMGKNINSIKEGDVTINYEDGNPMNGIDKRINDISKAQIFISNI